MSERKKLSIADYKAAKQAAVKEQAEEIASKGNGSKTEYIDIEEGSNKIRVMPCHPDTDPNDLYAQQRVVHWVPMKKQDGTETRRPVLNAKVHGGQAKDIIEEYIAMATEVIKSNRKLSTKERGKKLDALIDFKTGLQAKGSYVMYAKKETKDGELRGLLEVTFGNKRKMDALATAELEEDPEAMCPISDPIDGHGIKITYDKSQSNNNKYSLVMDRKPSSLTDEDIEWLNEQKPLTEMLIGVYHKGNFDKAVEGLEMYDEKNGIGVFDEPDFADIKEELRELLPDAPERDSDNSSDSGESEATRIEDMDKNELKQLILDYGLEDKIKVTRKTTEDDILDALEELFGELPEYPADLKQAAKEEPFTPDEEEEEEEEEDKKPARASRSTKKAAKTEPEPEEEEEEEEETTSRRSRRERRSRK